MIISDAGENIFQIRNRYDLKVIKSIEHKYGWLRCGVCYSEKNLAILGIDNFFIDFNYELMNITKYKKSKK